MQSTHDLELDDFVARLQAAAEADLLMDLEDARQVDYVPLTTIKAFAEALCDGMCGEWRRRVGGGVQERWAGAATAAAALPPAACALAPSGACLQSTQPPGAASSHHAFQGMTPPRQLLSAGLMSTFFTDAELGEVLDGGGDCKRADKMHGAGSFNAASRLAH